MEMDTVHFGQAFNILKPLCDTFIASPSIEHAQNIKKVLGVIHPSAFQRLQTYLLYPLELHIQSSEHRKRYNLKIAIVDCMKDVIHRSIMDDDQQVLKLYMVLSYQVFDTSKEHLVADVPEEFKLSVVQCATELIKRCTSGVLMQLYNKHNVPQLGHGLYLWVQIARYEKLRPLRLSAIECLMAYCQVHDTADPTDIVLRSKVADVLMFVLPGIVGALHKIATGDEKQGHKVMMLALRAWARVISIVMEDGPVPDQGDFRNQMWKALHQQQDISNESDALSGSVRSPSEMKEYLQVQHRTEDWLCAAGKRLSVLAQELAVIQHSSHPKMRMELVMACRLVLECCARNMSPSLAYLVEILITLTEDTNIEVAAASKEALDIFSKKCKGENTNTLLEILEENFYILLTRLPRIMRSSDEAQQLAVLNLLVGNLRLLGAERLPHVLRISRHLERLASALVEVVQLDTGGISLLHEYSLRDFSMDSTIGLPARWKQFRHFSDPSIVQKIEHICWLLGEFGDMDILCNYLLDMFHNAPEHRKEIIFLLNEIFSRGLQKEERNCTHLVQAILATYLASDVWGIPLEVAEGVPLGQAQSNVVQACLLVEGVGRIAGATKWQAQRVLFAVLERAGSPLAPLAAAGHMAAQRLAEGEDLGQDIAALVREHANYFACHVRMGLRHEDRCAAVLDVLGLALRTCSIDVLPTLHAIATDLLLHSADKYQDHNAISFLRVFQSFIICIKRWIRENKDMEQSQPKQKHLDELELSVRCSDIIPYLLETQKNLQDANSFSGDDVGKTAEEMFIEDQNEKTDERSVEVNEEMELANEHETSNSDIEDDDKKKLPPHIEIVVSIMKRCIHLLPTRDKQRKLIILETLEECVGVLADFEDELLPLVHQMWLPLAMRFSDLSDPLVVNRSFSLLCAVGRTAKDFIRSRSLKEVLPALCQFLTRTAEESRKKDSGSAYRFTQVYKLQLEVLQQLGGLVVDLRLQPRQLHDVLRAAVPYLSSLQPPPLQDACVKLFQRVSFADPEAVWLRAVATWSPTQTIEAPHPPLQTIQLPGSAVQNIDFKKNIELILQSLSF